MGKRKSQTDIKSIDQGSHKKLKTKKPLEQSSKLDTVKEVTPPQRDQEGNFVFEDEPLFYPNMSPKEVIQAGSFGGTYFRPIKSGVTKKSYGSEVWKEFPPDWFEGLDIQKQVASPIYDVNVNTYRAKCGSSLEAWESSNWIKAQDPYGWFQWYCRYYRGRRSDDDKRQIGRWSRCAGKTGRWRNNLISKIHKAGVSYDNKGISPVVRQVLQHWAYKLTEKDYKAKVSQMKNKE